MAGTKYKVVCDSLCLTTGHKARKIEAHLNREAEEGWELAAFDPVLVLGFDVGFYLVLKKDA
jgi:hypothetical protein